MRKDWPYLGILFPTYFQQKYPILMKHFKNNVKSLTTGYDLHATLRHILELDSYEDKMFKTLYGISLFGPIPVNRTCIDANVEPHFCSCLDLEESQEQFSGGYKINSICYKIHQ